MKIKKDVPLKHLTTFQVGGSTRYLVEVDSDKEVAEAVNFVKKEGLAIFVLGGGSDILVSDSDFEGVVIKHTGNSVDFKDEEGAVLVAADAGVNWDSLVKECVARGLQGIEAMSGIPGTVGASPIQNIGAYGQELVDNFVKLTAYDVKKDRFLEMTKKDCEFSYRESVFKKPENKGRYIITKVFLKLKKDGKPNPSYQSLIDELKKNGIKSPTALDIRQAVLFLRGKKLEDAKDIGNAGSFFKNPIVDKKKVDALLKKYPEMPFFEKEGSYKLFSGWLIENAGWKGRRHGNAFVSEKNALVITNPQGKATAKEIKRLSEKIAESVEAKFGVKIEPEVQFIGFEETLRGKNTAVVGFGIEGKDLLHFLKNEGAKITVLDKKSEKEIDFSFKKAGVGFVGGKNYLKNLHEFDVVFRSPGVYRYLPEIVSAEKKGVLISSAIKLFFERVKATTIGVTGTKGKGTTASLIYEILKKAGRKVHLAGNIGVPYLSLLSKIDKQTILVLELSSFQLIDMEKSPNIAVVTNVTKDHMDWHRGLQEYIEAKKNIVRNQKTTDSAFLNRAGATSASFAKAAGGKVHFFDKKDVGKEIREKLLLKGEHNLENVAAAAAVARKLGVKESAIKDAATSFKGLEHRLELVGRIDGISYYNDSFATSPSPSLAAVGSFEEPTTLILGGSSKGLDYSGFGKDLAKRKNLRCVIVIGEVGGEIKESLVKGGFSGKIIDLGSPSMKKIVETAKKITPKAGVVLLSPAAASFDMFENYKERGKEFKKVVRDLNG